MRADGRNAPIWFSEPLLNKTDFYGEKYGMGIVLAGQNTGIGRYEIA